MHDSVRWLALAAPVALVGSTSGYAVTYLTVEQAQEVIWPGAKLTGADIVLTPEQRRAIERKCHGRVRQPKLQAWRVDGGGWFIVDHVIGKHEFIDYAVGIEADGTVRAVEILDYRETYGGEIRNRRWRAQFNGKSAADPLTLDRDIKNISGATLSCRSITDGVRRLLATHEIALQ